MPCSDLCVLGFLTCVRLLSLCVYACACPCLCVQLCGCVQVHMHVCTHECGDQRSTSAAVAQKEFIFLLGTVFLTRTWSLSSRLGWLTSQPQEPPSLAFYLCAMELRSSCCAEIASSTALILHSQNLWLLSSGALTTRLSCDPQQGIKRTHK